MPLQLWAPGSSGKLPVRVTSLHDVQVMGTSVLGPTLSLASVSLQCCVLPPPSHHGHALVKTTTHNL